MSTNLFSGTIHPFSTSFSTVGQVPVQAAGAGSMRASRSERSYRLTVKTFSTFMYAVDKDDLPVGHPGKPRLLFSKSVRRIHQSQAKSLHSCQSHQGRVTLADAQCSSDFLGNDHPAQFVDPSYDSRRSQIYAPPPCFSAIGFPWKAVLCQADGREDLESPDDPAHAGISPGCSAKRDS